MNKLYNTQEDFASSFANILKEIFPSIRKTQLNIIPYIIFGMICAESTVINDIANKLVGKFKLIQFDSIIRRIRRFFNNKLFNGYSFYDAVIRHVIKNYKKKHDDNRVHVIIDHMFSHDIYTTLMMSLRIGKQGIPIWFRCFKGKKSI